MTDFLTADTNLPSYMMFPRFLLDMEINETAKMLYIILLDRARLSQKNEGWSDTDGHVFIYFTIEALAEVLHKSQMTVKTALAVLEKQELIFRKRQGPGQPNRIYVKLPKETIHYTDRFLSLRQAENCPIDRQDSFPDTDRKLSGNKKEIKKNNLAIRGSKEPRSPYGKFQNVFLSEKELEDMQDNTEYQANLFAADLLLSDADIADMAHNEDLDYFSLCSTLNSTPELMSFKLYSLTKRGQAYHMSMEIQSNFLAK